MHGTNTMSLSVSHSFVLPPPPLCPRGYITGTKYLPGFLLHCGAGRYAGDRLDEVAIMT